MRPRESASRPVRPSRTSARRCRLDCQRGRGALANGRADPAPARRRVRGGRAVTNNGALIREIREANLNVYRASPARLREDVGSEAEIAHDYQGRLIFELLQNADDAMGGSHAGTEDRIRFVLTDDELLVMNSGRPLTEADVRGLTSTGASSKTGVAEGGQRASIGHKGMGFKSILEITDRPEVYSTTYKFVLDAEQARPAVTAVLADLGQPEPDRVPIMRFPWQATETPRQWTAANGEGFNVLFRFPFKPGLGRDKVPGLAEALLTLPATTILFLKNLEVVEIDVRTAGRAETIRWSVRRERDVDGSWVPTDGLSESGVYQVWIESDGADDIWCFLLGHEADVVIGDHRGGLNAYAWEGVDLTEVTVAALLTGGESDELPTSWRRFHVFLPTAEASPYPLLVNGAFATDLSRQEVRVVQEAEDYNQHLTRAAAKVLCDVLLPAVIREGGDVESALRLLARSDPAADARPDAPGHHLHLAVVDHLATSPLVPTESNDLAPVAEVAVPATFDHDTIAAELRALLAPTAASGGRALPVGRLCAEPFAGILIDLGARSLTPTETVELLADGPPELAPLHDHSSGKLRVDPVLHILQTMWENADKLARDELEHAVRSVPLFPVALTDDGSVERIAVGDTETFFPPRALHGTIPLKGLRFMLQDLCWGSLSPRERTEVLRSQMPAWIALFQIREFKFPDVMRVSVLPALALDADPAMRTELEDWSTMTAVCQLSGPTPSPDTPLPYGRLGSQRALFNLCRMPVPCTVDGEEQWVPAYRAYFGTDWIGEGSVEPLLRVIDDLDADVDLPVPLLMAPDLFVSRLEQMRGLREAENPVSPYDEEDDADNEVGVDEDDEQAAELDAKERWLAFLTWLGVNHVLRPVHFHDAGDRAKGWISTKGLARPSGWAFRSLETIWDAYVDDLRSRLDPGAEDEHDLYFYRLHDIELLGQLTDLAAEDASCAVADALFAHLAHNWARLERFTEVELAILASGTQPARRVDPPKADAKELQRRGADLWLFRLRRAAFCPTGHGPRQPALTWWRSSEVERRFDRRGSTADMFLAVLSEAASAPPHEARRFSQAIGIRSELTPAVFTLQDAHALARRIEHLYAEQVDDLAADTLRNQINPAYQHLFELLSGRATGKAPSADEAEVLRRSRLLVHDGRGHFRFDEAHEVLYAPRGGLREIHGIDGELWTFVLEGRPAVSAPLQRLFGARNIDDVLRWEPQPDDSPLDEEQISQFRDGLWSVAPYLLARLRAERAEEERASRDAARLRTFIERVEPVRALSASCSLEGSDLLSSGERQAFVDHRSGDLVAFVRWGDNPWPPDPSEAEALATAITEVLDVGYFEPLLALLTAEPEGRGRLLHLAGASGNLDAARDALQQSDATHADPDGPGPDDPAVPARTKGDATDGGDAPTPPQGAGPRAVTRTRLIDPELLGFDGDPITERGTGRPTGKAERRGRRTPAVPGERGPRRSGAYGGGTDLDELDGIGMRIALAFEVRRLAREGVRATIFDPQEPLPTDGVFDVSTPGAIARATDGSTRFKVAIEALRQEGVAVDVPGFDILTLDEHASDGIGRMIELKSSGVNARTQAMTWNEWKTAKTASLRSRFYLYLVGNLRADIDAAPYLRAIRDPFEELRSTEQEDRSVRRKVQLDVHGFLQAEYQVLTVRRDEAGEST